MRKQNSDGKPAQQRGAGVRYRVEELAAAAGVRIDTIRFYQSKGLLPPPARIRRAAVYGKEHLDRLEKIRRYQSQGLSLAVIKRLVSSRSPSTVEALLGAVADQSGDRSLTRAELAARSGIPDALLASLEAAGLLTAAAGDGESRYGEGDLQMLRAALSILQQGFPLHDLLQLAIQHDRSIRQSVDAAIELFNRYVRRSGQEEADPDKVAEVFRELLPAVTRLVALHFQRTLLNRAFELLRERGEHGALEVARKVVDSGRLDLEVSWR